MAGVTIVGAKELSKKLRKLPAAVGKKVIRQAFRKALKPVRARVQELAPVESGQTKRAVKIKAGRSKKGRISLRVVIGKGDYQGDQYYASFQEYGWKSRFSGRKVPGKHFMKQAFEETAQPAKAEAERLILEGVEAEARR